MSHERHPRLLIVAVAVAFIAAACGGDETRDDTVIASIADREFTQGDLDDLLPDGENTVPGRIATVVEGWLTTQALEFELDDLGFPVTDEDRASAAEAVDGRNQTRNDTERDLQVAEIANSFAISRWLEEAVEDAGDPTLPDYLCANHLLVETEDEAADALQRYIDGEAFADLAMELSTGPSGPDGGDLGCAVEGQFVPEFEAAAYEADNGEVVGPVETSFGWHLIEVETVGPADLDTHPDADPAELAQIAAAASRAQIDGIVFDLQQQAAENHGGDAEIDDSIGTFSGEGLQITPA
ncbi:MAG: peptidylprolyl isomerase [Actinomycetota bacterium]